jgi:hypothetical protein
MMAGHGSRPCANQSRFRAPLQQPALKLSAKAYHEMAMSPKKKAKNEFPPGWDEERVRKVIEYYDNQSDDEAIAEAEAALEAQGQTWMMVPTELVPIIRELIERVEDEIDIREARKAIKEADKKGSIPWDQLKKELRR